MRKVAGKLRLLSVPILVGLLLAMVVPVLTAYTVNAKDDCKDPADCHKITIEKTVDFNGDGVYSDSETWYAGKPASWKIVVTNASAPTPSGPDADWVSGITVTDTNGMSFGPFDLPNPGDSETFTYTTNPTEATTNIATAEGTAPVVITAGPVSDDAAVQIKDTGLQGCTPGFWRNHLDDWAATGYSTTDDFDATFGVDLFSPNITLQQAVNAKGGNVKKLARHGTAALLSAAHPDVAYPLTVAEVIAAVQAGDVNTLVDFNELLSPICN